MRQFFLTVGLCFLWLFNATAQLDTSYYTIYFEVNQAIIHPKYAHEIQELLNLPNIQSIELEGHTDSDASDAYNVDLAVSRVAAVQSFLINNGADYTWLSTKALGEKKPKLPNTSATAKAQNRRVEVVVFYQKVLPPIITEELSTQPVPTPTVPRLDTLDLDNRALYQSLSVTNKKQLFKIADQTGGHLTTRSGMKVHFVANSFTQSCGDSIVIQITEYNTRADILTGNMTTLADEELLYSSGMFEIKAFCENQALELKQNQNYTAFIPITKEEQESNAMQCFYGERDEQTQQVNWLLAKDENKNSGNYGNNLKVDKVDGALLGSRGIGGGGSSCWFVRMMAKVGRAIATPFVALGNLFSRMGRGISGGRRNQRMTKAERKALKQKQKEIRAAYANVPIDEMDFEQIEQVQYYIVQPTRMNLINCDAFYRVPKQKLMAQRVTIGGYEIEDGTSVRMVFVGRRSVMNSSIVTNKHFSFYNVPRGREVYLVATKIVNDPETKENAIYLGVKNIITKPSRTVDVAMEPMSSVEELHQRLKFMQ